MTNSPKTTRLHKINIKAVGYILSTAFQTTKGMLNVRFRFNVYNEVIKRMIIVRFQNLVKHRPDLIDKCIVKGVMDIAWTRCLWQLNQVNVNEK